MDNNDVFWLNVSVEYFPLVHILHSLQEIANNEGGSLFTISFLLFQFGVQLTLRAELQQNVNVLFVLETPIKVNNIGMVEVSVYLEFPDQLIYQFFLDYLLLAYHFECSKKTRNLVSELH